MKKLLYVLLIGLLAVVSHAKDIYFDSHYTLWKDGDILIWNVDKSITIDPKEFCLSLKRNNTSIGDPKCRIFGEWERDSVALRYATWLGYNLEPGTKAEYLKARHPAMIAKIQALEDKIVMYVSKVEGVVRVALFDETAGTPKMAGTVAFNSDPIALYDDMANTFFDRPAKRRLTKKEREKLASEPDEYYRETPNFNGWIGVGLGYSQAKIPLTPDNWYRSHIDSRVRKYRVTKDSTSLWNFIDDSDPFLSLYAGGTWYGFIGAEIIYRVAKHNVKTDSKDTSYDELDYWYFYQHEIGLSIHLSKTFPMNKWLDITPFVFLGFQYSFFVEEIDVKDDVKKPSAAYEKRVEFEEVYKGALVGIGSQFVFAKHYGISMRTGISSRGRDTYSDPSPDAAAEPTTIGGSTIDWFVSLGLEYHWVL